MLACAVNEQPYQHYSVTSGKMTDKEYSDSGKDMGQGSQAAGAQKIE
jgi:hypothetical protein